MASLAQDFRNHPEHGNEALMDLRNTNIHPTSYLAYTAIQKN